MVAGEPSSESQLARALNRRRERGIAAKVLLNKTGLAADRDGP